MTRRYVNENGWKTYNLTYDGYAGAERVAMRTGTADPLWLLGDHLGSTSAVANYDGTLYAGQGYKAWGEWRYSRGVSPLPTTFRYTGQREASFGLYFYGARWYDGYLNRWAQPDSIVPLASQGTQAWDRYAYVNNSPVNYTDPTGHMLDDGCRIEGCDTEREKDNYLSNPVIENLIAKKYWDLDYVNSVSDRKAAQAAYIHFLKDPAYFANLYAHPEAWATSEEVANLDVFMQYSVFHTTAQDAVLSLFGTEDAGALWSANLHYGLGDHSGAAKVLIMAGIIPSTGRTIALNLREQLAMEAVMADPMKGIILPITMKDPGLPASAGWVKMAQNINGIEIHYVYNQITGQIGDFKFK
jgi:RHS repeat-associated protein